MLHMLVCAPEVGESDQVLDLIDQCCDDAGDSLDILAREENAARLTAYAGKIPYSLLTMIETVRQEKQLSEKLKFASTVQQVNQDNQLLLVLQNMQHLIVFVNSNTKPCGVVIPSAGMKLNEALIHGIVDRLHRSEPEDQETISVKVGNGSRRIKLSELIYVEACGKHINLYTELQCITIIDSLKEMKERLGDRFLQCHRSYLVNKDHIESADYSSLMLKLSHEMAVPIARTQKAEMKAFMTGEQ